MDISERFWSKVNIQGKDDCWNWKSPSIRSGSGVFKVNNKNESAYRIAFILTYKEIPDNLWVLHKCDNRLCCNPEHLFLGTYLDNIKDKVSKNRQSQGETSGARLHPESLAKGENTGSAKLRNKDIPEIRKMLNDGIKQTEIAKIYGVHKAAINRISLGKLWKSI